ncbi:MAG: hypothetical protein K9M11_02420 [Candidatus Pacebacteria bacterium]|nr:hypothetical protein [Candidatus Paceibacterota bacterium]
MDIVSRVKVLNLPVGKYCVFGSGVLEIHGIRKAKDVDVLVTPDLYLELKKQGWKRKWIFWRTFFCKAITNGSNEAFTNLHWGAFQPDTTELIKRAEFFDGIPFLRLEDLLAFLLYSPRKKDKDGVRRIEEYFASK